jgi:hypothetical protein
MDREVGRRSGPLTSGSPLSNRIIEVPNIDLALGHSCKLIPMSMCRGC